MQINKFSLKICKIEDLRIRSALFSKASIQTEFGSFLWTDCGR